MQSLQYQHLSSSLYTFNRVDTDKGDPFYDNVENMAAFADAMAVKTKGFSVALKTTRLEGMKGAPVWIWNRLSRQAHGDGCAYFYQLNDDIRFLTAGWTRKFVDSLEGNPRRRGLGVTGPTDIERRFYLTQSFVSRAHLDVFNFFYPKAFRNWYSDNWITDVYRPVDSFFHHTDILIANTNEMGMRYFPASKDLSKLDAEVKGGLETINAWLAAAAADGGAGGGVGGGGGARDVGDSGIDGSAALAAAAAAAVANGGKSLHRDVDNAADADTNGSGKALNGARPNAAARLRGDTGR
jgi:hypothetical protein